MINKPNSIISFICSFLSLTIVLDYLLWPRAIKASETIEQGIQIKLLVGITMLFLSVFLRIRAKKLEHKNNWIKSSGIINAIVIIIFVVSLIFYTYIELTK